MSCTRLFMFDFDGTLFDSRPAIAHCFIKTCEQLGKPPPSASELQATLASGASLAHTARTLMGATAAEAEVWVKTYRRIYESDGGALTRPFDGAEQALAATRAAGFSVVVVSNKGEAAIHAALQEHGMAEHVTLVVGDAADAPKKPDPAPFERVVRPRLQVAADANIAMLGDTMADLLFARNIGASAWWARYGYGDVEACLAAAPDQTIDSLRQVTPTKVCGIY